MIDEIPKLTTRVEGFPPKKVWLLSVSIEGLNFHASHWESLDSPSASDPAFDDHIKRALARSIGADVADAILTRLKESTPKEMN